MEDYLVKVKDRLAFYTARPDPAFLTVSGYKPEEEAVMQKLRQFWADEEIPNEIKLQGFDLDLTHFNPRNTTFNEMKNIGMLLMDLGIIDLAGSSGLDYGGVEFNSQGYQINKDKKFDAFAYLNRSLEFLKTRIHEGHEYIRDTMVKVDLAINVLLALEERAQQHQSKIVDLQV